MTESREDRFARIAERVWAGVQADRFRGSDPYDGLNSRLLAPLLTQSRLLRLAVIQGVKRSPIDLRPLLGIPPGLNPKGLALMIQGAREWPGLGVPASQLVSLADSLLSLASLPDGSPAFGSRSPVEGLGSRILAGDIILPPAIGWGYDFPWQSKAFFQPRFFPTVVASSFALDALELSDHPAYPAIAAATSHFVADHLHRHEDADGICLSYSPGDIARVFNASLFGGRILAQAAPHIGSSPAPWQNLARRCVDWVTARQNQDGSWIYGEASHWQWIDDLHTGFNLESIWRTSRLLNSSAWDHSLERGLEFYRSRLFEEDGLPHYYAHNHWPIDPHSFAQGALTFLRLQSFDPSSREFAARILDRAIAELWDERRGGFRFQKHRHYGQSVIHLRWSQAWMFRALSAYLGPGLV